MRMTNDDLSGAWRKLQRAKEHISQLDAEVRSYFDSKPYLIVYEPHSEPGRMVARVNGDPKPLPANLPLMIGDAVHNLRSSLDHLAWQAVGSPTADTAFPLFRDDRRPAPKDLRNLVEKKLKGASNQVISAVIALEPYRGGKGDVLWKLHQLDIFDKHRLLIPVVSVYSAVGIDLTAAFRRMPEWEKTPSLPIELKPAERTPLKDGVELYTGPTEHFDRDYQLKFKSELVFAEPKAVEGEPVVRTLGQVSRVTEDVVSTIAALI